MVQNLIDLILCQRSKKVKIAENERETVDRLRDGGVDLIRMDIQMPVMAGIESTRSISRLERANGGRSCPCPDRPMLCPRIGRRV